MMRSGSSWEPLCSVPALRRARDLMYLSFVTFVTVEIRRLNRRRKPVHTYVQIRRDAQPLRSNGGGLQLLGVVGGGLAAVHHQGEEVKDEGRRGDCGDVCVVVGRGDLDDVGANDVD